MRGLKAAIRRWPAVATCGPIRKPGTNCGASVCGWRRFVVSTMDDLPTKCGTSGGSAAGIHCVGRSRAPRPSAIYTGVVPIVYKAQRALLDSLISSAVWSFVTITPLLMFVSRGVRAGIVAMLPNALPVLVVFGGMGWLGLTVDIGAMMSASIALGVAVDDTIHFLTWFREDLQRTADRHAAILDCGFCEIVVGKPVIANVGVLERGPGGLVLHPTNCRVVCVAIGVGKKRVPRTFPPAHGHKCLVPAERYLMYLVFRRHGAPRFVADFADAHSRIAMTPKVMSQ